MEKERTAKKRGRPKKETAAAVQEASQKEKEKPFSDFLEVMPGGRFGGQQTIDVTPWGTIRLRLVALYRFGMSVTKLQFGPSGAPRILPGVLVGVPGDPMRVAEGDQYIGFSNLRFGSGVEPRGYRLFVEGQVGTPYGLLVGSTPVIMSREGSLANTVIRIADGTIGFSFFAARKFEISTGFVLADLRWEKTD